MLEAPLVDAPLDDVRVAEAEQRMANTLAGAALLVERLRHSPGAWGWMSVNGSI